MQANPKASFISNPLPDGKTVFKGKKFEVRTGTIKGKNGNMVSREVVTHPGAVIILPILDQKQLILIQNQRFAVEKVLWELPAGTLEENEDPQKTALRELQEETGYQAKSIEPLPPYYTTPGFCNESMFPYVAKDLIPGPQALEETEEIVVEIFRWEKVIEMIKNGTICDGKTIATLLYYNTFYLRG